MLLLCLLCCVVVVETGKSSTYYWGNAQDSGAEVSMWKCGWILVYIRVFRVRGFAVGDSHVAIV